MSSAASATADKFVKRGEQYIVVEGHARDDRGRTLMRTRQVEISWVARAQGLMSTEARESSSD
jgi:hypothetical protein